MHLRVFTAPGHEAHRAEGHLERPERIDAALRGLRGSGVAWVEEPSKPAGEEDLLAVHTPGHLATARRAVEARAWIDPDTYTTVATWDAALRAAGAAVGAAESALAGIPAFALARPPGHHAERARPMGFCLLNNVAIAAQRLARRGARVAIVDVDVHHGNGTQDIFYDREDVLFVSLHGSPLYPGTGRVEEAGSGAGAGKTLNLPVPANTGHDGWMELFDAAVLPAVRTHRPDVVLVSAGFDGHRRDPIGNCLLVAQTFHACIERLRAVQPRIAAVLEGGYDLDAVAACTADAAAALAGAAPPVVEPVVAGERPWARLAARVRAVHPELDAKA